jgi:hypothetical protein
MIEFVRGPNNEPEPSKEEQQEIREALLNCTDPQSSCHWLNMIYNNAQHFFTSNYAYHTYTFLTEIVKIAKSKDNKIVVMGSHHNDTGHTSGVILHQPSQSSPPYGCFVVDTYIRFTVKLPSPYKLHVLNEYQIFHFLTNVPQITWTQSKRGSIVVYNVPHDMPEVIALNYFPIVAGKLRVQRGY